MQQRVLLVLPLLVVPVFSSASALSAAKQWLASHASSLPNEDQLSELKQENPDAYAMVNALLAKRSLGLGGARLPASQKGPETFLRMMSTHHATEKSVAVPYAQVKPEEQDWLHWKPDDSAKNDEAMVDNVLGAVAQMRGLKGKARKKIGFLTKRRHVHEEENVEADDAFMHDAELFGVDLHPTAAPVKQIVSMDNQEEQQDAPVERKTTKNSYLEGLNLSGDLTEEIMGAAHKNHKLKGDHSDSQNYLAGFSFGDSLVEDQPTTSLAPKAKAEPKNDAFLNWLGVVKKAPPPRDTSVQAAAPKTDNPYILDLLDN